jgi:MFS family permease
MSEEAFDLWGWRIPFFLSAILILVGMLIRFRIMETPLFAQLKQTEQVAKTPVREVVRKHWWEILLAAGCRIAEQSCFYLFTVYVIAHVPAEHNRAVLRGINLAAAIEFFTIPLFGIISDHWSRRGMYVLGCAVMAGFALPYFALLGTQSPALIMLAIVLSLTVGHAMLYSVQASLIPELFGTRLRYSGASIGYQLASPLAGGLAPLIATELARLYPGNDAPLAAYIVTISLLSMVCVLLLAETSRKDISTPD